MKLRVTPLNIVQASIVAVMLYLVYAQDQINQSQNTIGFYFIILACLMAVTVVTDLIFRIILKDLKRIWIVEMIFIIIAAILMLILQKVA